MVDDILPPKREGRPVRSEETGDIPEPTFAPPETIAHEEEVIDMADPSSLKAATPQKARGPKKPGKLTLLINDLKYWWNQRTKKEKIILAAVAAGILIGLGIGGYLVLKDKPAPKPAPSTNKKEEVKAPPKPTTEPSHLTGMQVPPEYNLLPVTGIMIENSPDARPQGGLKDAGVVFEAIAEGGITRFLALYQEAQPAYVGPVRSARPYYLQWLQGFDAAVAHVGGSPDALAKIKNEGIKDLDQFYNGSAYQRITQRYAPHNVYTNVGSLIALSRSKGWNSSNFTGFARKEEKPVTAVPTAKAIDIAISGPLYNARYDYEAATNSYVRSQAGQIHRDDPSGLAIKPKVVIVIVLPQGVASDGLHTTYNTLGNGVAFIFQDGAVVQGTWSKGSDKEQFRFGDANGSPVGLNPGQTWITAVGALTNVTFAP